MNKISVFIVISSFLAFFFACKEIDKNKKNEPGQSTSELIKNPGNEVFWIEGEGIILRSSAGISASKVVNEKATSSLGTTEYCEVNYSTKVKILEESGDWTKIQVVVPDWLSDSHIGWIPTKNIIKTRNDKPLADLEESEYEIIKTRHNSAVQNFHVLIKKENFDKEYLHEFVERFRKKHCTMNCNVSLYDSKSIEPLIGVYPLEKKQYIEFADHLLSISTFDAVEVKDWYPYQDFKYNEYGGKNWKKIPIK